MNWTQSASVPYNSVIERQQIWINLKCCERIFNICFSIVYRSSLPSKHEALAQCWADVGPSSTTLAQHQPNIGPTPRVCWVITQNILDCMIKLQIRSYNCLNLYIIVLLNLFFTKVTIVCLWLTPPPPTIITPIMVLLNLIFTKVTIVCLWSPPPTIITPTTTCIVYNLVGLYRLSSAAT